MIFGSAGHRVSAMRRERQEVVTFCRELSGPDWTTPSAAEGWTVHEVLAHLAATSHAIFTPAALSLLRTGDIERTNDDMLGTRRGATSAEVFGEFVIWSARVATLAAGVERTPVARAPMPLGELGLFPTGLVLTGAFTFDMHTHLRHDIAPALGRPAPGTDAERIDVVLAWMLAVLSSTVRRGLVPAPERPVVLDLRGPGGGAWTVCPDGAIGPGAVASTVVTAPATGFPDWGTRRSPWRDHDVDLRGDADAAARFLDTLRVV